MKITFNFKEHNCCSMLIVWELKVTVRSSSLICLVILGVEVTNKVIGIWLGWVPSHKNLVVERQQASRRGA